MTITTAELTESWHPARLIPTVGIRGQEEQEKRATSSLLAVLMAVPEFGHALFSPLGAPKGKIQTFTEVQFKDGEGRKVIPDGVVVVERGKNRWVTLVEVKTGEAELGTEQVTKYLDVAKANGFTGVLTISNAITASPDDSPVTVHKGKLRSTALHHLSWWRIITEAVVQHRHVGISDPDQQWLLGELIAYLNAEPSGASGFTDMGDRWVRVRDAARAGTLRASDPEAKKVCERWEQFTEFLALGLAQDLGRDVSVVRPRKQDPDARLQLLVKGLADDGWLSSSIKVPDAVGALDLCADLRTRQVTTSVTVDAPGEGRPLSRITWLLRQLKDAPGDLRIEVAFRSTKETTSLLLSEALENPNALLSPTDPKRLPRAMTLAWSRPLGTKRGRGQGSFVAEARGQAIKFYREIVQDLSAWQAKAPKLPDAPEPPSPKDPEPAPFAAAGLADAGDPVATS